QVVVACDVVVENQACVETAARLADWLDATLRGIFVEDEALLHLTAIPPVRYVGPTGESFAAMDERSVLHQFESHAARMRAVLEAAARAGAWLDLRRGSRTAEYGDSQHGRPGSPGDRDAVAALLGQRASCVPLAARS